MEVLQRINAILRRIENLGMVVCLALMVLLTLLNVLLRGLYTHAGAQWANALMGRFDWSEPLVRLLVLWVTFLAASAVTRERNHIRIDLAGTVLSGRWRHFRNGILSVAGAFVCTVMLIAGAQYVQVERSFGASLFLNLPSWVAQIIIPAGFGVMGLRFSMQVLEDFTRMLRGAPP